jgi:hypothetical protein
VRPSVGLKMPLGALTDLLAEESFPLAMLFFSRSFSASRAASWRRARLGGMLSGGGMKGWLVVES